MTDQELDKLMRHVLLDSLHREYATECEAAVPFEPSWQYRRQIKAMLKDPLKWLRNKTKPIFKLVIQRVAVILLVVSISLGGLMAISPTVRAAVIRWVMEWYETQIVYRYSGDPLVEKMPEYEITEIPDNFVETDRIEHASSVSIFYEDGNGGVISFDYVYMHQGGATVMTTDNNVIDITVHGLQGQLFLPTETKNTTTITWIDPDVNIQFTIDTTLDEDVILYMAERVSL